MPRLYNELLARYRDLDFDLLPDDATASTLVTGLWSTYLFLLGQIYREHISQKLWSLQTLNLRGELFPIHRELYGYFKESVSSAFVDAGIMLGSPGTKGVLENIFAKAAMNGFLIKKVYQYFYSPRTRSLELRTVFDCYNGDMSRSISNLVARGQICQTNIIIFCFGFVYSKNPSAWLPVPSQGELTVVPAITRFLRANLPVELYPYFYFVIGEPLEPVDLFKTHFNSIREVCYTKKPEWVVLDDRFQDVSFLANSKSPLEVQSSALYLGKDSQFNEALIRINAGNNEAQVSYSSREGWSVPRSLGVLPDQVIDLVIPLSPSDRWVKQKIAGHEKYWIRFEIIRAE